MDEEVTLSPAGFGPVGFVHAVAESAAAAMSRAKTRRVARMDVLLLGVWWV
jgi:hypothetical protein